MTTMTVALAGWLVAGVLAAVLLVRWQTRRPPASQPTEAHRELCEVCGEPATHELSGDIAYDRDGGGFTAMVACYCEDDAPDGAVKVA